MSRQIVRLTDTKIKNAKPEDSPLYDGDNLMLKITKASKRWYFRFKQAGTDKYTEKALCKPNDYPTVSLAKAREITAKYKKAIAENKDPFKKAEIITIKRVFDEWKQKFNNSLLQKVKERKVAEVKNNFINKIDEYTPINDITKRELVDILEQRAQTAPARAKRFQGYLNEIFSYAETKGYIENNFIKNISLNSLMEQHKTENYKAITDEADFKKLVKVIYSLDNSPINTALKILLHLPLRSANLISMQWREIDFMQRELKIPRSNMKVKSGDDFILPLSDEVIKILETHAEIYKDISDYVFMSRVIKCKHITAQGLNNRLKLLGFTEKLKQTAHSFRSTFRTIAQNHIDEIPIKNPRDAIESFLDHKIGNSVEMIYNRADYKKEKIAVAKWWSEFIIKIRDEK